MHYANQGRDGGKLFVLRICSEKGFRMMYENIDTRPEPQSPWIDRTHIGLGIKPHRIGIKNKLLLPGTITLTGSVGQTL